MREDVLLGGKLLSNLPLNKAREVFKQLLAPNDNLPTLNIDITNTAFSYDGITIPMRVYRPCNENYLPAMIFFHGGGFVFGDLDFIDYACMLMADKSQCVVISVEYRKAPEFKFPCAHNDCYQAVKYIQNNANSFGCNGVIAVGGESAGGNLAASICHMAKKTRDVEISFQVLYYPWLNLANNYHSARKFYKGYLLEVPALNWMRELFLSANKEIDNMTANPLLQDNFIKLPPTLIINAECDPIRDDGKLYFEKLNEAGVEAQYIEFGGTLHGFFATPWFYDSTHLSIQLIAKKFEMYKQNFKSQETLIGRTDSR